MTSRLIAGAGEVEMPDVADPWGDGALNQPPPVPPPPPPVDRMAQLVQQMALLWDENLRL